MIIDPVTSLADLEFKVKTNKYYKQLAILGCRRIGYYVRTYELAMKNLHISAGGFKSCEPIIQEVNCCCDRIVEEKQPTAEELIKRKYVKLKVNNLKKKRRKRRSIKKAKLKRR